jgi:putative transposase
MYSISRFQEIMQAISRGVFDRLVDERQANKYSKGFSCWDQLVVMIYAQLSGMASLREIETGFNSQPTHHYHLGTHTVRRSTLADANNKRNGQVFADLAHMLMRQAQRKLRHEGEQLLYLLDSTSITLKGRGFDEWTVHTRTRNTQGIKLHVLYEAGELIPLHESMTAPNVNDIDEALKLSLRSGARYVFDKGYCDYNWWARIDTHRAWFVTRFKRNASLQLLQRRAIAPSDQGIILADEIVRFANKHPRGGRRNHYHQALRRVVVQRPGKAQPLVLATNDLDSPAGQIAHHYKLRWQIELFFKWLKQHLRIRRFVGRSENAVRIQILCALITYLLVALYREKQGLNKTLWHSVVELRATMFQRPLVDAAKARRRRQQFEDLMQRQPGMFA